MLPVGLFVVDVAMPLFVQHMALAGKARMKTEMHLGSVFSGYGLIRRSCRRHEQPTENSLQDQDVSHQSTFMGGVSRPHSRPVAYGHIGHVSARVSESCHSEVAFEAGHKHSASSRWALMPWTHWVLLVWLFWRTE